jgi:hypothetical protein
MVTAQQLRQALAAVHASSEDIAARGIFDRGVPVRLRQWIPIARPALAAAIATKAGQHNSGTGADYNGRIADALKMPSLEALVMHYEAQEPGLCPAAALACVQDKFKEWGGPLYQGPWP